MAVDKLVDSTQLDADLTSVANAIRTKGGTSAQLAFPSEFVSAVQAIPTGSGKTLIADYTASEDVSLISISGSFDGYLMYLFELIGDLSANEWIYPSVNGSTQSAYYWPANSGKKVFNLKVPMCTKPGGTPDGFGTQDRLIFIVSGPGGGFTDIMSNISNGFSSMSLKLYNVSSLFKAGFSVKLWGITV